MQYRDYSSSPSRKELCALDPVWALTRCFSNIQLAGPASLTFSELASVSTTVLLLHFAPLLDPFHLHPEAIHGQALCPGQPGVGAVSWPWLQRMLLQICGIRRGARAVQVEVGDWSGQLSSCCARPGSVLKLVQPQILDTGSQQTDP